MNNHERELWVLNDEGLYLAHKASKQSLREFIRENKQMIDDVIYGVLNKKAKR